MPIPLAALALIAAGGGVASSAIGAAGQASGARAQANAQLSQAREQRGFDTDNALDVMMRNLMAFYGPRAGEVARQFLPQDQVRRLFGLDQGDRDTITGRLTEIQNRMREIEQSGARGGQQLRHNFVTGQREYMASRGGGGTNPEYEELSREAEQLGSQLQEGAGRFSPQQLAASGPGFMGQMQDLIRQFTGEQEGVLGEYDTGAGRLMTGFDRDTERLQQEDERNLRASEDFGTERKNQVDRDVSRASNQANAAITAQMKNSGLGGSSLVPQALAASIRRLMEAGSDRKSAIDDQYQSLTSGIRNANVNRLAGRFGQGTALRGDLLNRRTALRGDILGQQQSLRQQPLQQELALLTGGAFAPFSGRDTSAYFPGVTGRGIGSSAFGSLFGSLGGQLFGAGAQGLTNQLRQGGGGGGGGQMDPQIMQYIQDLMASYPQ